MYNNISSIKGKIITLEENSIMGGFGENISRIIAEKDISSNVLCLGIKDFFAPQASVEKNKKIFDLDGYSLFLKSLEFVK